MLGMNGIPFGIVFTATGSIIESSLDKGRGYVATMLVANGTLKMGDIVC